MKYGFIYKEYSSHMYFWEIIKIYLKLSVIFLANFYNNDINVKSLCVIFVALIYLIFLMIF